MNEKTINTEDIDIRYDEELKSLCFYFESKRIFRVSKEALINGWIVPRMSKEINIVHGGHEVDSLKNVIMKENLEWKYLWLLMRGMYD